MIEDSLWFYMRCLLTMLFVIVCLFCAAQKSLYLSPQINLNIGKNGIGLFEYSMGYYPFQYRRTNFLDYKVNFGYDFGSWQNEIGFGYTSWSHKYEYEISNAQTPSTIFENNQYFIKYKFYGFNLNIKRQVGSRLKLILGSTLYYPKSVEYNGPYDSNELFIHVGNDQEGELALFGIGKNENLNPNVHGFSNIYLRSGLSFSVISNVELSFLVVTNLSNKRTIYSLYLYGSNEVFHEESTIFNNIEIRTNFIGLELGVSYKFILIDLESN